MCQDQQLAVPSHGASPSNQMALNLPCPAPAFASSSYSVTGSNAQAMRLACTLAASNDPAFLICGPRASGKSHLLHVVAELTGAQVLAVSAPDVASAHSGALAFDNCQAWADPRAALVFLERRRIAGQKLILAGEGWPRSWAKGLKDLETRLEGLPRVELGEPDEELLTAVIRQQFQTRQLRTRPGVAAYAAPRIPRTFAAADAFVTAAAAAAAAAARPISRALAKKVVENLFEAGSRP